MSALQERLSQAPRDNAPRQPQERAPRAEAGARGLPGRYAVVAVGSALLLVASVVGLPAGPMHGQPLAGVATALSTALGLALLIFAALPQSPHAVARLTAWLATRYARWGWLRGTALALSLALAAGTTATFAGSAFFALKAPPAQGYLTDIISFGETDARLTLAGRNPYTSDDVFWTTLRRYPAAMATPFQRGRFAGSPDFPSVAYLYRVQREDAAQPNQPHPEFDPRTLHSYPALSFLVYVPLLALGIDNILWLHVIVYWALYAWLIWLAPLGWRGWSALAAGTALTTIGGSLFTANDVFCVAFILTAWRYRRHLWTSAALLGLGCAFKQYAWFFAPIFLAEALAMRGWGDALRRGLLALGAFFAPNLPYIIASPRAWVTSLWLPMSGAMFQQGVGLIALSMDHALPYLPPLLYSGLEVVALLAMTTLVWRHARTLGDAAPLLALVPLFFAGRVFPSYFAFAPWLAVYAINTLGRPGGRWAASLFSARRGDQPHQSEWRPLAAAGERGD